MSDATDPHDRPPDDDSDGAREPGEGDRRAEGEEPGVGLRNVHGDRTEYDHRSTAAVTDDGAAVVTDDEPADENATLDRFLEDDEEESYLLEVKRSARKRNPAVGEAVFANGAYHRFEDRERADEWAADLAETGGRIVWIQDAPPHDRTPFDGYLVGRRPIRPAEAPFESEQTALPPGSGGE